MLLLGRRDGKSCIYIFFSHIIILHNFLITLLNIHPDCPYSNLMEWVYTVHAVINTSFDYTQAFKKATGIYFMSG